MNFSCIRNTLMCESQLYFLSNLCVTSLTRRDKINTYLYICPFGYEFMTLKLSDNSGYNNNNSRVIIIIVL